MHHQIVVVRTCLEQHSLADSFDFCFFHRSATDSSLKSVHKSNAKHHADLRQVHRVANHVHQSLPRNSLRQLKEWLLNPFFQAILISMHWNAFGRKATPQGKKNAAPSGCTCGSSWWSLEWFVQLCQKVEPVQGQLSHLDSYWPAWPQLPFHKLPASHVLMCPSPLHRGMLCHSHEEVIAAFLPRLQCRKQTKHTRSALLNTITKENYTSRT